MKTKTKTAPVHNGAGAEAASAVHLELIQNLAQSKNGEGAEVVESYHRALFQHQYAKEFERLRQQQQTCENRLAYLQSRLSDTHEKLSGIDKLSPVRWEESEDLQPNAPWNHWDRVMFWSAACGILCLVLFGILNISFNLLESGLVTFQEHPYRAYFWTALLPVGALAVKIGWDFLRHPRLKNLYVWSCLAIGVSGVLVWLLAYASVYPTLSKTTQEHIESLSVFDAESPATDRFLPFTGGGVKRMDMIIVAAQAVAEIFLSAALGIYMTVIYLRHRPVRLALNPMHRQRDEERRRLEEQVEREHGILAAARGGLAKLENQLSAFLTFARSIYDKEVVRQKDQNYQQNQLLNNIHEQLRRQLHALEPGAGPAELRENDPSELNSTKPS